MQVFGIYVWNILCPQQRLSDTAFTASSVVVMGIMSVVCSAARGFTTGFSPKVVHCWGAMAFIVCVGAPVGSMVLTPAAVPYLRALFYVLAALQFTMFAALKIQGNGEQWLVVAVLLSAELLFLAAHKRWHAARLAKRFGRTARRAGAEREGGGGGVEMGKAGHGEVGVESVCMADSSCNGASDSGSGPAPTGADADTAFATTWRSVQSTPASVSTGDGNATVHVHAGESA